MFAAAQTPTYSEVTMLVNALGRPSRPGALPTIATGICVMIASEAVVVGLADPTANLRVGVSGNPQAERERGSHEIESTNVLVNWTLEVCAAAPVPTTVCVGKTVTRVDGMTTTAAGVDDVVAAEAATASTTVCVSWTLSVSTTVPGPRAKICLGTTVRRVSGITTAPIGSRAAAVSVNTAEELASDIATAEDAAVTSDAVAESEAGPPGEAAACPICIYPAKPKPTTHRTTKKQKHLS
jgi:hypothetical protein